MEVLSKAEMFREIVKLPPPEQDAALELALAVYERGSMRAPATPPTLDVFVNEHVQIDEPQGGESTVIPFRLWPEQARALCRMASERLLVILKARQLGITWLACAYALWLCVFKSGQVVLLFSKGAHEAYELARRIRVMYFRLPEWMRAQNPLIKDNLSELQWANGSRVQSLAATRSAGRSFTASLVLMDEAAFMQWAVELYTALKPTIDGGGQLFVVSTANGEQGFFHKLWKDAEAGLNNFSTVFLSWRARPGRDEAWRARVAAEALSATVDLQEYPGTADEAFQATGNDRFLPSLILWDACQEPALPPADKFTPLVLAADGAVSGDTFGLVGVSRHPAAEGGVAVRLVRAWEPKKQALDYDEIEREIVTICQTMNVSEIVYDPYQLHQMMGGLEKRRVARTVPFNQGAERLTADKNLLDLIMQRRLAWTPTVAYADTLRAHIDNADRKLDTESRKLRIVKRAESLKIDLAVCLSMAAHRITEAKADLEEMDDLSDELLDYRGR